MSLSKTILDVRNMQRSVALRNELDPKKVVEVLQQILQDSVVSSASNSRAFQKKAYEELVNIRRDLAAGQINAGVATGPMTGIFSHLIDQMDNLQNEGKQSNKKFEGALDHLTNSIPSADTFIAALMTANPLLGYGVKVVRDIGKSSKAFNASRKEEARKREKLLMQQESFLQEQLKLLDVEEKAAEEQIDNQTAEAKERKKNTVGRGGTYKKILDQIHEELIILRKEWTGEARQGELIEGEYKVVENLENSTQENIEKIENLNDSILEQTESDKENSLNEMENEKELERLRNRDEKLEQLKESPNIPSPNLEPVKNVMEDQKKGFTRLLDGLLSPILLMARSTLVAFGLAAVSLIGTVIAIPTLIATAIYKFLDGFFNAEEIIGKSTEDITMLDRIKAGVANIWGTALRILDWVAEALGLDFFDSKDMEKRIYKALDAGEKKIISLYNNSVEFLVEKYDAIITTVTDFFDEIQGFFDKIGEFFTKKYTDFMSTFDKFSVGGFWDSINPFGSSVEEEAPQTNLEQLEEQKRLENQNPSGKNFGSTMGEAERNAKKGDQAAPPTIIAPNTNNNTTNNNTYGGPPTTFNHDPDFRSTQGRNKQTYSF